MQPDSYDSMREALTAFGLVGQLQNDDQLVVSSHGSPVWPNHGNSFWLSHKKGDWYLNTWLPAGYKVPADQDILALCSACMGGVSAMYRLPSEIVARFKLQELDEVEYERLFPSA